MGFCLFNNAAVARGARDRRRAGSSGSSILDWDVHHGNGTQDIFYESDRVLYASIHQSPCYPGTGAAGERGAGAGEGYTLNLPVPGGRRARTSSWRSSSTSSCRSPAGSSPA